MGHEGPWSDLQTSIRLGHDGGRSGDGGGGCWLCVVFVVVVVVVRVRVVREKERVVVVVWLVLTRPVGGIARGMGRTGGDSRVWMRLRMRLQRRLLMEEILFYMERAGPGLVGAQPAADV